MRTPRDPDRLIAAYLEEDVAGLPDRVLDAVRSNIEHTKQRVVIGPWRIPRMNRYAKLAIAAAAVVVIAIVGYKMLPGAGTFAGPGASPSASASPSPTPRTTMPSGTLAAGVRYSAVQGGVRLNFQLPTSKWDTGNAFEFLRTGTFKAADGAFIGVTRPGGPRGTYSDPCAHVAAENSSRVGSEIAEALATIPGVDATAPVASAVGGKAATFVAVTIPEGIGCGPSDFFLYYDPGSCEGFDPCPRWASALDSTYRIWLVDVDGTLVWIETETYKGASSELVQEIQDIVDSIQFE
jgi:hypothetical protein